MIKKKLRKAAYLFCIICAVFAQSAIAQSVTSYSRVDSLQVGDSFNYSIVLNRNTEYDEIVYPDSSAFGDVFEIQKQRKYHVSSYRDSVAYKLQFFGTADTTIPQLPVSLVQEKDTTTLYTKRVLVPFHSVLAKDDQSLRPLKPIFEFASAWWPYLLGALLLALAAYLFYEYYWKQQEEETTVPQQPFKPTAFQNPLKTLENTIKELEEADPSEKEEFKDFYIKLGDAIRQYYETMYSIPALESTSRELILMLKKRAADDRLVDDTKAVLQEADMVKFANFTPTTKQSNRALAKANQFIGRASEVDGPRLDYLRRKHQEKIEKEREHHNQKHQQDAEDTQ